MCPLQTGDVIYWGYRNNKLEHNMAYLYEYLHEKQDITHECFEAAKENVFHMTKDTSVPSEVMILPCCLPLSSL